MGRDPVFVRARRRAVAAGALTALAAACGSAGGSAGPSPDSSPTVEASTPDATTTVTPTPTPAAVAVDDFFVPLPEGYAWVEAPSALADEIAANMRQGDAARVVEDVAVRQAEYGSVPAGMMVVLLWTEPANAAVRHQLVEGFADAAGVEPEAVDLGGQAAMRLDSDPIAYAHTAERHAIMLLGQDDQRLQDIMTAVLAGVS